MAAHIQLRGDLAEVARLNLWLDNHPGRSTLSQASFDDIKLCLNEIVANAITYGFPDNGGGNSIEVKLELSRDRAIATVTDNGVAFDPLAAPMQQPMTDVDTAPIGGFGLMLVRKTASDLHYSRDSDQNRLTMVFDQS